MDKFEFLSVKTLSEALEAINRFPEVRVVSGATNVMNYIRAGKIKACTLVDISKLDDKAELNPCNQIHQKEKSDLESELPKSEDRPENGARMHQNAAREI